MKKMIIFAVLSLVMATASAAGKSTVDTVACNNALITKWITDVQTNEEGKDVIKYYVVYNGRLVSTSKSVIDKVKLCQKHNIAIALACVRRNKKITRIILD